MNYIGKVCPYCKTEFKEGDDIVVCSVCEMPHHKECWIENNGCTTFGCTGTIEGINQDDYVYNEELNASKELSASKELKCANCGTDYVMGQRFCENCGANILEQNQIKTSSYTNYGQYNYGEYNYYDSQQIDDIRLFTGENSDYYIFKFLKLKSKNRKVSWNWSCAIFGGFWFIYRKMYGYAALYILLRIVFKNLNDDFFDFINGIIWICSAVFGNYLYMRHTEGYIREAAVMEKAEKEIYLKKHGGTSTLAVILSIVGIIFFCSFFLIDF